MNFASILEYDELANFSMTSQLYVVQNLHAVILHDYGRYFLFEPNFRITKLPTRLWLDRTTGQIIEKDFNEKDFLMTRQLKSKKGYSAFLGFLNLMNQHFIVMVENAALNCQLESKDIYSVCSVEFIAFENLELIKKSPDWKFISKDMEIIKNLLSFGFYFSFTYDLTRNTERLFSNPLGEHDPKFWWNHHMLKDLIAQNVSKQWQIPLIQGFIKNFAVYLMGKKLEFYLISRKSCKKPGTRYNSRGIDDDGYVANFVETEQILFYSFYKCSFVQIRGSVPIFWEQKGLTAAVRLSRSIEASELPFRKHFEMLRNDYQRIICVNLMARKKKEEQTLTDNYEGLARETKLDFVKYEYFDFHFACKGQKYENVDFLIEKMAAVVENLAFFAFKTKQTDARLLCRQYGVLRVNCLDCLDRTNLVMTKFAALMLQNIMKHMNTDLNLALGEDFIKLLDIPISQSKKFHPFVYYFKNAWADNGDFLSVHYAGTGSTTSTVTRTSKVGFLNMLDHGMKSIERFFINNFEDHVKQQAIELLLGQQQQGEVMSKYEETLESQLLEKRHEYIEFSKLVVGILTWNVSDYRPTNSETFPMLFSSFQDKPPDILVIGLQEIDSSSLKGLLLSSDTSKLPDLWQNVLKSRVSKMGDYFEVANLSHYGCFLSIYALNIYRQRITRLQFDEIAFGSLSHFSNRGGILMKMHFDDSSICFINGNFDSGEKKTKDRLQNLNTLHANAFGGEIEAFEYKFLFGDLNFRLLGVGDQEIRQRMARFNDLKSINEFEAAKSTLKELLDYDETWELKKLSKFLDSFEESEILFLPTYKLEKGKEEYETGRSPAWCDRIMVWRDEDAALGMIGYQRNETNYSCHRPVCAIFEIEAKCVDHKKKGKIIEDYIVKIEERAMEKI